MGWPGRPPGSSQGEAPWSPMVAWPLAGRDQPPCQAVERLGKQDGFLSEVKEYPVIVGVDIIGGQTADGGRLLGVEQDEEAGEPVFGLESVVVEEAPGLIPAGFGVEGAGGSVPAGGGEVQVGVLAAAGPADEVPGPAFLGGARAGHPGVQVALSAGGQGEAVRVKPVQERHRRGDVSLAVEAWCWVTGVARARWRSRRSTCQVA